MLGYNFRRNLCFRFKGSENLHFFGALIVNGPFGVSSSEKYLKLWGAVEALMALKITVA